MSKLEIIDRTILQLLQTDAKMRLDDIAAECGASVATVQRRIKSLKTTGVIRSEIVVISPTDVDYAMTFLILVELERERNDHLDAFKRKAKEETMIQQCYYITGEADFALIVLSRDMEDYKNLIERMFLSDSNVKRFRTSVVLDRTKIGMHVPI